MTQQSQISTAIFVTGVLTAVFMPLIGFIIGLTQINRGPEGIWIVAISILAFLAWLVLMTAAL